MINEATEAEKNYYKEFGKMRILLAAILMACSTVYSWAIVYDTTGVFNVSERTVNIPTLPGGSTSTMSNSKIYYPSEGSGVASGVVPCPIVVFGHGFNISIDQYVSYGRHLASWGYVVVIPTISNPFPLPSHYGRAIDMKAAARYVAGLDTTTGDIFYGKLDRWNWAFAGHSMGGSIACLAADTLRISDTLKCVVSFSGPQSTPATHPQHIAQPLLILEASNDQIALWNEVYTSFYRGGTQPATFGVINGGNHSQFTDSWTSPIGDGSATITRGLQRRYARRHLTAWLERYLKGSRTPLNYHVCFGDSINGHSAMSDTVVSRYANRPPARTVPSAPFDCAVLPLRRPTFGFSADDDIDQLWYRLYLDDLSSMASPDSAEAGSGQSSQTISFNWGSDLTHNMVYYWRAKARDGSGQWGQASEIRSFTVDTTLPSGYCSWRQSRAGQFSSCAMSGTTLSGDSVMLSGSGSGTITGPEVGFGSLSLLAPRSNWGYVKWGQGAAEDSIVIQIEYRSGSTWSLIPNSSLPGNSSGFSTDGHYGFVRLTNLDTTIYKNLRLKARLVPGGKSNLRPALLWWEMGSPDSSYTGVAVEPGIPDLNESKLWLGCRPTISQGPVWIEFNLPRAGRFSLESYNIIGEKVATIAQGWMMQGRHRAYWAGNGEKGRLAPGTYFIRLKTDGSQILTKCIIVN